MNSARHFALGALLGGAAAVAPDAVLALYGWRRTWLPVTHPLVRVHRLLHSVSGLVPVVVALAWTSHVIADRYSAHRKEP